MNRTRRKDVQGQIDTLASVQADLSAFAEAAEALVQDQAWMTPSGIERLIKAVEGADGLGMDTIAGDVTAIKEEEDEAYENLPENVRSGARGDAASRAAGYLSSAEDCLCTLISALGDAQGELTPLLTAVKAAEIDSATGALTFKSPIAQDLAEGHVEAVAEYLRDMVALAGDAMDHLQQSIETS